tara:strand:+ start:9242 stop:9577 length:336 start_codon:yes stop_codon:yes gene_type:complete
MSWGNILKAGTCYQTAFEYVFNDYMQKGKSNLILVHADVTGTGGNVEGQVYGHAFVLDGDTVIDTERLKHNDNYKFPYDFYKRIGNVTNEKKYTVQEAGAKSIETGNYGPW